MPRRLSAFLTLILAAICLLQALHDVYAVNTFSAEPSKEWTFLVYLDADNNLETFGIKDFLEMTSVGSDTEVNIVVQMDRAEGYDTSYGNWTSCRRFYITENLQPTEANALASLGEVNMGDPKSFVDFAMWAIDQFPARKYAVVFWDHGNGCIDRKINDGNIGIGADSVKGVCYDENDKDQLTILELQSALEVVASSVGARFDIIGFDACLMSMVEIAYQLQKGSKIMVASEETEPGNGWPYDDVLTHLTESPQMLPEDLASVIVQDFVASYQNGNQGSSEDVTLSALWLDKLALTAIPKIDNFAELVNRSLTIHWREIIDAIDNTENYRYPAYRDIYDFAYEVKKRISDPEFQNATDDLTAAIEFATINEAHGREHVGSHGLSVYLPSSENEYYCNYESLDFALESGWDEFLHSLFCYVNEKESFFSVRYTPFDSDGDGCNDGVKAKMDVDTTGGIVNVTVYGRLINPVDDISYSGMVSWTIKGNLIEYGQLFLFLGETGTAGFYDVELFLYDEAGNFEDYIYRSNATYLGPPLKVAKILIESSMDEVQIGDEITVRVRITGVYILRGFELNIEWNASLFVYVHHVIKIPIELFTDGVLHNPVSIVKDEIQESGGYYMSVESESLSSPFNGSGIAVELVFKAKALGVGEIKIVHNHLDSAYDWPIPHKTVNGTIRITGGVRVLNVTSYRSVVGESFSTEIDATIVSQSFTEDFVVTLYLNETLGGMIWVASLLNTSVNITFCWNTTGFAKGNYVISVRVAKSQSEAELSMLIGSSVLVTVAGDIDGNRSVDNYDFELLKASFATQESATLSNADINCDDYFNAKDAVLLGTNFGSNW